MKLSKSIEDYLEEMYVLEMQGLEIKLVNISKALNVSKPAVTKAMRELMKQGFVTKEPYKDPCLTEMGRKIAKNVYHRHIVIHNFLEETLKLPHDIAEKDCCLIEHVISEETLEAIEKFKK